MTLKPFTVLLFSHSVRSNSLHPNGLQHARLPCPSLSPGVCSNSCPLSQWCHLILCCPLLLLPSVFPSIRVFSNELALHIKWQSIGASVSVLPINIQDWFPLGLTGWISVQSKRFKSLLQHHSSKASILWCSAFLMVQPSHSYVTTGKIHSFDEMDLCWQGNVSAF